jgi:hypothetical protein
MLKDALCALKQLSFYLQSNAVSVTSAGLHIENLKNKLIALKDANGECLEEFLACFNQSNTFKDIPIVKSSNDDTKFLQTKSQFFQALHDNIVQRFPCDALLTNALVLNHVNWPNDPIDLALYGTREIATLCKDLDMDSNTTCNILMEFTVLKKTKFCGPCLTILRNQLETYPLSTAACERGFSQMTLCHTKIRNRLCAEKVSSLLMVSINGPHISHWNAKKYVISWLRNGHKWASDKATKEKRCQRPVGSAAKLFML